MLNVIFPQHLLQGLDVRLQGCSLHHKLFLPETTCDDRQHLMFLCSVPRLSLQYMSMTVGWSGVMVLALILQMTIFLWQSSRRCYIWALRLARRPPRPLGLVFIWVAPYGRFRRWVCT